MSPACRISCLLVPAVLTAHFAGCAQLDLSKTIPFLAEKEDQPGVPTQVVAMWSHEVLYHSQPNRPPRRGFGGRLMFYGGKSDRPIKVDGTLVVYAFDEEGRTADNVKPDRKFVFTSEQLPKYYSKSELGHSYSVWLPWDELGGPQKEISLIVRFLPNGGPVVIGQQSKHPLPGSNVSPPNAQPHMASARSVAGWRQNGVQPVAYNEPIGAGQEAPPADSQPARRMSTATIRMPPRFARQGPLSARRRPLNAWRNPAPPPRRQPATQAAPPARTAPTREGAPLPQARYSPGRSRVPGGPISRPTRDRGPWQPYRARSRFPSAAQPAPATAIGSAATSQSAPPAAY